MWRWDQGRLQYFQFDAIKKIARCLARNEGISVSDGPLRAQLEADTGLPYLPVDDAYPIWRNYGRCFKYALLATKRDERLVTTELCRWIDENFDDVTSDEYLSHVTRHFRYPSPAVQSYAPSLLVIHPFAAVLKFLLARSRSGLSAEVSIEEVFSYLIGNAVSGNEDISYYSTLSVSGVQGHGDQTRQVRELLIFLSQFSFLAWDNPRLLMDEVLFEDLLSRNPSFFDLNLAEQESDGVDELINLGRISTAPLKNIKSATVSSTDFDFTEGKKTRVTHLRVERSAKLRRLFFSSLPNPSCDACGLISEDRYPDVNNVLEAHHVLPLSSSVAIGSTHTSLEDLVALCPTCHKAVHGYYKIWLGSHSQEDFSGKAEAREVYESIKNEIRERSIT